MSSPVKPVNQQELIELLARATETSVRHAPGFISASLHRGLDGTKVTMYAQWRSVEDYQAVRENPAPSSIRECMKSSRPTPERHRNSKTQPSRTRLRGIAITV
jgi:quinol monooxygenase YgiN